MDDIAKALAKQLGDIEAGHRRQGKRIAQFHRTLAKVVEERGIAAGMSPDVVANITGPKVPPADD